MSDVASKASLTKAAQLLFDIAPRARTKGERRLVAYRKLSKIFSFHRVCEIDRQSNRVVITADELQFMREIAHGRETSESSRIEQRLAIVEAELASLRAFRAKYEEALAATQDRRRRTGGVQSN